MRANDWKKFFKAYEELKEINLNSSKKYEMVFKVKLGDNIVPIMNFKDLYNLYYSKFTHLFQNYKDEFLINKLYNYKEEDVLKNYIIARFAEWQSQ